MAIRAWLGPSAEKSSGGRCPSHITIAIAITIDRRFISQVMSRIKYLHVYWLAYTTLKFRGEAHMKVRVRTLLHRGSPADTESA